MTGNKRYETVDDLPVSISLFPLSEALLLPFGQMPLNIFEPRYIEMIDAALGGNRIIGMVQPAFESCADTKYDLCRVGCAGRIVSFNETGDGRYMICLVGICRFSILEELETTTPFRQAVVNWHAFADDLVRHEKTDEVDRSSILLAFQSYLDANNMDADWESIEDTPTDLLVNTLSMMSPHGAPEKQALLEATDLKTRAETLVAITEISLVRQENDGDVYLQ